jgi:hypothetical protein
MMMTAKQIDEVQAEASAWPFRKGILPAPKEDPAGTCAEDKPVRINQKDAAMRNGVPDFCTPGGFRIGPGLNPD